MTYWSYESCYSCSGKAQPGTVALLKYLLVKFPATRSMGIYNCRNVAGTSTRSIHSCGRALDLGIPTLSNGRANTELGHPVVRFLGEYAEQFGIHGQIYDRVRYDRRSPNGRYYGGSHPHYDHNHIEQVLSKATSLSYADYVAIAGDPAGGADMLLQKGSKGQAVAEAQKMMAEAFGQDNGSWSPFDGKSAFDGKAFSAGEDGSFGDTATANTKNVQGKLGLAKTGAVDQLTWDAMIHHAYGGAGGDVDLSGLVTKATFDAHRHAEGTTGPPK